MANDLIKSGSGLPVVPPMQVSATESGTAIGQVFGDVRLEMGPEAITLLKQIIGNQQDISHAAEWALLSTEMFHVFVLENEKYNCGTFSITKRLSLTKHTPTKYADHFRPLSPQLISELIGLPCLFAIRNQDFKVAPTYFPAVVGRLKEIIPQGDCIKFTFVKCGEFRQQFINENPQLFNILSRPLKNQLDEEHWSIRTGNLLEIAANIGVEIK